jgi:hypothetical protein
VEESDGYLFWRTPWIYLNGVNGGKTIKDLWGFRSVFRCLRKFAKRYYYLLRICLSVRSCLRMEQLGSQKPDLREIWYLRIFRKSAKKGEVSLKSDKNNGYCTWRPIYCTFMVISRWILLRMRNVADIFIEEIKTHFMFNNFLSKIEPFLR